MSRSGRGVREDWRGKRKESERDARREGVRRRSNGRKARVKKKKTRPREWKEL